MSRQTRYPTEVRERAVRMGFDHKREYDSQRAAITSSASKHDMQDEAADKLDVVLKAAIGAASRRQS